MKLNTVAAVFAAGALCALVSSAFAQSASTFTYQGHLSDNGSPADGMYEFQVRLLDGTGVQVGMAKTLLVDVSDGMFKLDLDYGASATMALRDCLRLVSLDTLRPGTFNYNKKDHFSYIDGIIPGFIAQEVQRVIPEWVEQGSDGYLYLNPIGYEAMVVDAIQELRAEKDAQISSLQAENDELRARLESIERTVMTLLQD